MENWPNFIFDLIAHNDLRGLQMALNAHPDAIEMLDRYLNTPLLYACQLGYSRIVRYLLGVGANSGQLNIFGKYMNLNPLKFRRSFRFDHHFRMTMDFQSIRFFVCSKIQGQNALTLATYSDNLDTCQAILNCIDFNEFNATGLLTPLCVATLQGNIDIAKVYLRLESSNPNVNQCPSETIHGVCPLQLAQIRGDTNMMELLWPEHQPHLHRLARH